jgi:hypothetical protein
MIRRGVCSGKIAAMRDAGNDKLWSRGNPDSRSFGRIVDNSSNVIIALRLATIPIGGCDRSALPFKSTSARLAGICDLIHIGIAPSLAVQDAAKRDGARCHAGPNITMNRGRTR